MNPGTGIAPGAAIVLGTAQFGLDYGIANASGRPDEAAVDAILAQARAGGITALDTAVAYGDSESRLGRLGAGDDFALMTKLPAVPDGTADVHAWVRAQVEGSLRRLRVDRLAALSLHRPGQLHEAGGAALADALREERGSGRAAAIGASIYDPQELPALFEAFDFDLVQAPGNVFDRRILASGWSVRLAGRGCRLHLRSCFLQGLLLLPSDRRPLWSARWSSLFARWDQCLAELGLEPMQACLRFALSVPGVEKLVLGVDSPGQLEAILKAAGSASPLPLPDALACDDPDLVNPARWPTAQE